MMAICLAIYCPNFSVYDVVQFDCDRFQHLNRHNFKGHKVLTLDSVLISSFLKEVQTSQYYRNRVLTQFTLWRAPHGLVLQNTKQDLIDYYWNKIICKLVWERCEMEHALSWLSTLGGAFSALGDYFEKCAETAGRISMHQLKLALKLGDPNIQSRCRLYLSLSLIQKKRFNDAKRIIEFEYKQARNQTAVRDERLVRMCKGIWAKLQYEHSLFKRDKNKKSSL